MQREARSDRRCMARATSSLPVPVSPVIRNRGIAWRDFGDTREYSFQSWERFQQSLQTWRLLSISSRRATFFRGGRVSSACLRSSMSVPRNIPTCNLSLFVAQWVKTCQKTSDNFPSRLRSRNSNSSAEARATSTIKKKRRSALCHQDKT